MSWIEKTNTKIRLFLGDGEIFLPEYLDATKEQTFNSSSFEFPNVVGTLVRRENPKGRTFKLNLIFKGPDHLDISKKFEKSSLDKRHWHIKHPLYDDIRVQPISIKYGNKDMNLTRITCDVVETILDAYPKSLPNPQDEIQSQKDLSDQSAAFAFVNQTDLTGNDISTMNESVNELEASTLQVITDDEDSKNFLSKVAEARAAIAKATTDLSHAMTTITNVILAPSRFNLDVFARQKLLLKQFLQLKDLILGIVNPINSRKYYESTGSLLLSTAFFSASNPQEGDYQTSKQVTGIINEFAEFFNTYIEDLDGLQQFDLSKDAIYLPDTGNITDLQNLYNLTVANLFDIALNAKTEIIKVVEKDSNVILLTHNIYGLDESDENLDLFIETNDIGIKEHLIVKKGREVKYYV